MRSTLPFAAGFFQNIGSGKINLFTSLWTKPQTRDERVKEYVPEVIEESLAEQRAVVEENTSRDVIVELGHKVLREIENKSPTPNIAPHIAKIMQEYGSKNLIAQRPLSYLLYPNSALSGGQQSHELIANFFDNFRDFVDEVERNGCSARFKNKNNSNEETHIVAGDDDGCDKVPAVVTSQSKTNSGPVIMTPREEYEPKDITLFVKIVSAMALANIQHGDCSSALVCVDVAISHVVDQTRLGGLLGMKAGILVYQKKYEEALTCAKKAVEVSQNIQGYIHGSFALRMLKRPAEAVELLEKGREHHPMNTQLVAYIEDVQKEVERISSEKKMIGS